MKRKELKRLVMFTAIVTSAIATPFIAKATLTAKAATVLNQQTDEQTPVYVWVSPQGSDTASGTEDSPFATLQHALAYVRSLRLTAVEGELGEIHIVLRGGVYRLASTLTLTKEDSGTHLSPTIIEAAEGELPVLSGGVEVGDWQTGSSAAGLPTAAQGQVWSATWPMSDGTPVEFRQLWVNGTKMHRASTLDDLSLPRLISVNKSRGELTVPRIEQAFAHPERLQMTIIQDWAMNYLRVKTLQSDDNRSRLTFMDPESSIEFKRPWPILRADQESFSNHMFFLSNAIELLNRPQEWVCNPDDGRLYYWPREGENASTLKADAPILETLISIEGSLDQVVSNIEFRGISFEHTTWYRPNVAGHVGLQAGQYLFDAYSDDSAPGGNVAWVGRPTSGVSVKNARSVSFEDCRFEHMGSTGLDFVSGTKRMNVRGCVFNDIGGTAILAGYFGDETFESHLAYNPTDKREVCDTLVIDNNYITDIGTEDWGCVGVGVGYAANVTISHNEICHTPYSAISLGWGWTKDTNCMHNNRITANYIHHFSKQMRDSGAIYTLSSQMGSVIENNRIESVGDPLLNPLMWNMRHAQFDLYLDEGSDYFNVRNNWLERGEISRNQNGSHNTWGTNNNTVSPTIKNAAGLQTDYLALRESVAEPFLAPIDSIGDDNSDKDCIEFVAQSEGFKQGNAIAFDLNNDNRFDIIYGGGESFQVQHGGVRINTGNYSFAATQGIKRLNMSNFATGDLNGDGFIDVVQAGWDFYDCYNAVLMNDGKGRLTEQALSVNGKNTAPACGIADIDNNGLSDYFFVGNGTDNSFYMQRQNRTFADAVPRLAMPGGSNDPNIIYADFNNDQSVDIALLSNRTGGVYTRIFYNDGTGKFTETNVGFTERGSKGSMTYADVNNDGYLDIAVGGLFYGEQWNATGAQGGKTVTVYLNDQQGGFIKQQEFKEYLLDNVTQPMRFCDWDNDGNTDLIITGWNMTEGNVSRTNIFLNDGTGHFTKADVQLPGVSESSVELADFGDSGRNDILITGNCNGGYQGFTTDRRIAVLCRNRSERINTAPTAPTNLLAEVGEVGTVTLSWDAGSDAETNTNALSYNYYLRDLSTGLYMTFPNADIATGKRRVSQMGNAWLNRTWTLRNLPTGTYAWSVQTIDAAYVGSEFAPEQIFTITDGYEELEAIDYPEEKTTATAAYNRANLTLYQYLVEAQQMIEQRGITSMIDAYKQGAAVYNNPDNTRNELTAATDVLKQAITDTESLYVIGEAATYGIVNPSFENITSQHDSSNAAPFGWTLTRNGTTVTNTTQWSWFGANTDGTDKDGDYVWGIWNGSNYGTIQLRQTLTGLPNGLWKLTARLMMNNTEPNNLARIYAASSSMLAGGSHTYTTLPTNEQLNYGNGWATSDFDMSHMMTVYAQVTDGRLNIGVRTNGFFKVDDFRLTWLGTEPDDVPITTGEEHYISLVTPAPLDLSNLTGRLRAYKVLADDSDDIIRLEAIDGIIGAGQPILFGGEAASACALPISTQFTTSELSGNLLRAVNLPSKGDGSTLYTLGHRDSRGLGFYRVPSGEEIPRDQPYLQLQGITNDFIPISQIPVGIATTTDTRPPSGGAVYNLSGQKLDRARRGINIQDGQKILVR